MLGGHENLPTTTKERNLIQVGMFFGSVADGPLGSPDAVETRSPVYLVD